MKILLNTLMALIIVGSLTTLCVLFMSATVGISPEVFKDYDHRYIEHMLRLLGGISLIFTAIFFCFYLIIEIIFNK